MNEPPVPSKVELPQGTAPATPPDFRKLFEASPALYLVLAPPDWTIVAASDAYLRATATTRAAIGRRLFDTFPDDPDDPAADGVQNLGASLARVVATRSADIMAVQRYAVRDAVGRFVEHWWAPTNTPVPGDDGSVALIIHQVEEVTELVRLRGDAKDLDQLARGQQAVIDRLRASEAALRESENRFRTMADSAPVMMWVTDPSGHCTYRNARWYEFSGQPPGGGRGYGWLDAVHPDDRSRTEAAFVAANAHRSAYREEFRIRRADGAYRWMIDAAVARFDQDGVYLGYVGSLIDIEERRDGEERLALSEERLRLALEVAEIGQWDVDTASGAMFWPPRVKAMFGISADVPVTLADYTDNLHADDHAKTLAAYEAASDPLHRRLYDVEYRTIGKEDGVVRWVAAKGRGIFDASGRCVRVIGTAIDVTARKADEVRLRELNEQLEQKVAERTAERDRMWRLSTDIMLVARFDGTIEATNPAWTALLGWTEADLHGRNLLDFVHPDDGAATRGEMDKLDQGITTSRFENRYRATDGSRRWISWGAVPDADLIHAVGRDVTTEKEAAVELEAAQDALRQSQKMEAMGQLTGGVAHDFNNLLTPIIGSLDMLTRRGVGNERERRLIDGALRSADRAKTLVQRLLAFARRQPLQASAVDLGGLVRGMAALIESTLGPTINVTVVLADDLPPAQADPNQLEMALLNLAVNARDAMPAGGDLTIKVVRNSVRSGHRTKLRPGHYVLLCVTDTGIGMDEATRVKAIEPFFSTKGIGKGTGLGLSMVHGLAAQLGGALAIESAPGRGTTIELWLPVSLLPIDADDASTVEARPRRGRGKALLVDDEELVRMTTADMLMDLGFDVTEASSAEDALQLIERGHVPDLLITDHLMPGMSGAELARLLRARIAGLPVLIVSGYAEAEGIAPDLPRLAKPFRTAELAERIASLHL